MTFLLFYLLSLLFCLLISSTQRYPSGKTKTKQECIHSPHSCLHFLCFMFYSLFPSRFFSSIHLLNTLFYFITSFTKIRHPSELSSKSKPKTELYIVQEVEQLLFLVICSENFSSQEHNLVYFLFPIHASASCKNSSGDLIAGVQIILSPSTKRSFIRIFIFSGSKPKR